MEIIMNALGKMAPSALLIATFSLVGCGADQTDVLWQTSTINALLEGVYSGEVTLAELSRHGDLGIGTFNDLDGEMVVLDGRVYQVRSDGKAGVPPPKTTKTPFAAVTFFEAERTLAVDDPLDYAGLRKFIDGALDTLNVPHAIRIDGTFSTVKVRSVSRQKPPYPRLVEVVKSQPVFEHKSVRGTMVGFRLPGYVRGVNVPGYHLHFLTADRKAGGHVLDFQIKDVQVHLDLTDRFHLVLPRGAKFYQAHLERTTQADVHKVER
jgi:acetolactate decarboxylase